MSSGANIIRGLVVIASAATIGYSTSQVYHASAQLHSHEQTLTGAKHAYEAAKKAKPTQKRVTTVYQRALDYTNKFMQVNQKWHDLGVDKVNHKTASAQRLQKQAQSLVQGSWQLNAPLIPAEMDWSYEVHYGGQNSDGLVPMVIDYYSKDHHQLMQTTTCYYNPETKSLSGGISYQTHAGFDAIRGAIKD